MVQCRQRRSNSRLPLCKSGTLRRLRYIGIEWSVQGLNLRPPTCKAGALPTELTPHIKYEKPSVVGSIPRQTALRILIVWSHTLRSSVPGMILIIPICSLIINSGAVFSYDELAGRGCEKAHEEWPTSCGFLNGVHSVRHRITSHLLFLTSILKSLFCRVADIK